MFNKYMNRTEGHDFIEYLAFQIKSGSSYKKAISRYLESNRPKHVIDSCYKIIDLIDSGMKPADALREMDVINDIEYTLLSTASNNSEALIIVSEQYINSKQGNDALKTSARGGFILLAGLLLLIPLFRDDIEGIYGMFAHMGSMSGTTHAKVEIPFLVKYWWSAFVVVGGLIMVYFGFKMFFNWLYLKHGKLYYKIFPFRINADLVSIIESLRQMNKAMSTSQSYQILSQNAPNSYWRDLFDEASNQLRNGGKASDIFASTKSVLPIEVVHCIIDGEDTGESDVYLKKAAAFSHQQNVVTQGRFKTWIPIFFDILLYFLVGMVMISFTNDMNELGILNVLSQVK